MKNEYCVYKHTTPEGMVYIGITNRDPEARWLNGRGYRDNPAFFNAILLYGWLNIEHEILYTGLNKEEASQREKELVKKYRSDEIEHGYNAQSGGSEGFTHNAETRKKISEASRKRWQDAEYRERVCNIYKEVQNRDDIKKRKAECSKKRYHENAEYREKLIRSAKEYMNTEEAKRIHREATKRKWNELGYREQWHEKMSGANNPSAKAIDQYTIDGTFIKRYSTCKEASEKTGTQRSGVSACAKGRQATAGGYVWKYAT